MSGGYCHNASNTAPCALALPPGIQTRLAFCICLSLACSRTKSCAERVSVRENLNLSCLATLYGAFTVICHFTCLPCGFE